MLERFYLFQNVLITLRFLTLCASVDNKKVFNVINARCNQEAVIFCQDCLDLCWVHKPTHCLPKSCAIIQYLSAVHGGTIIFYASRKTFFSYLLKNYSQFWQFLSAALFLLFPSLCRHVPDKRNEKFLGVFKSLCRHFRNRPCNNDPYMSVCLLQILCTYFYEMLLTFW